MTHAHHLKAVEAVAEPVVGAPLTDLDERQRQKCADEPTL